MQPDRNEPRLGARTVDGSSTFGAWAGKNITNVPTPGLRFHICFLERKWKIGPTGSDSSRFELFDSLQVPTGPTVVQAAACFQRALLRGKRQGDYFHFGLWGKDALTICFSKRLPVP